MDSTSEFQDFLADMEKLEPQIGGRHTPMNKKRSLGYLLMNDETRGSGEEKNARKRQRRTTSKKSFYLGDLIENDMQNFDGLSFDVYHYWANSVEVKQDDSAVISDWAAFICILSLLFYVNKEENNDKNNSSSRMPQKIENSENSEKFERELDQILFTNKNEVLQSPLNKSMDYGEYNYADQIMKDILDIPFIKENPQLQSFIFIEHSLFDDLIFRNPSIADGFDNQLYNTNSRSTSVDKQKSSNNNRDSQERQEKQEIQNIYHSLVRLRGDKKDRKTERTSRASNASQNSTPKSQSIMSENQNNSRTRSKTSEKSEIVNNNGSRTVNDSNSSKKSVARQLSSSQMSSKPQSRISTILTQTKKE